MKRICLLTVGCSGSGKTTHADSLVKEFGWVDINRDDVRFNYFCDGERNWDLYKFTKAREDTVTEICADKWDKAVSNHQSVIVSNTNLNLKDHNYWKVKAEIAGYEFNIKYFDVSYEELLKRDIRRGGLAVGRDVITKQWTKWLEITNRKRYEPDDRLPKAIICDVDGTIALAERRSVYDYSKVSSDTPRDSIIQMVEAYARVINASIIYMSGRDSSCRKDTEEWLFDNCSIGWLRNLPLSKFSSLKLYMRAEGDTRNDKVIKEELFWEHVAPYWNVVAAVDDRPRIVRLWNDLGIPNAISVQKGYEEF